MNFRAWRWALIAAAALLLAGGCARRTRSGVVTLRLVVWGSPNEEAKLNQMLSVFLREHPDIRVKLEITPHGRVFDKLLISFAGGRAPDVSRVSSLWFYPLAAKGILQDLTPFIESDPTFDLSDFYPVALDGWGRYKGRVYSLPTDLDIEAMYYNKKMFDRAHVPYPDDSWDWARYLDAARKLTKDTDGDGRIDQWGTTVSGFWQSLVYQNKGLIISEDGKRCVLDEPAAYEAIQFMADLRNKWHVTPSPSDSADVGTFGLFTMGRIGMINSGSWAAAMIFKDAITTFDWDVAPIPKGEQRAAFLGGAGFAMTRESRYKKEAWELVKFLTGPYVQDLWARQNQIVPSRRSVAESGTFLRLKDPPAHRKVFIDAIADGRTLPSVYSMREMNDIISNYISLALLGKTSARDVCRQVTPKINDLLLYDQHREGP